MNNFGGDNISQAAGVCQAVRESGKSHEEAREAANASLRGELPAHVGNYTTNDLNSKEFKYYSELSSVILDPEIAQVWVVNKDEHTHIGSYALHTQDIQDLYDLVNADKSGISIPSAHVHQAHETRERLESAKNGYSQPGSGNPADYSVSHAAGVQSEVQISGLPRPFTMVSSGGKNYDVIFYDQAQNTFTYENISPDKNGGVIVDRGYLQPDAQGIYHFTGQQSGNSQGYRFVNGVLRRVY
ncbi:hypothetical protein [Stenoxybacter acetivorans]|uniref:hypothetical protein n=1 Tax=Stenoxybacter acetivorans TaxID=422441 RepID=UPI0012EC74EA|nr:hypothetical protein [Stenoxybacter acetivorans]